MRTNSQIEAELKTLQTPAFHAAVEWIERNRWTINWTVGGIDFALRAYVSAEAAEAWRAYKDLENELTD